MAASAHVLPTALSKRSGTRPLTVVPEPASALDDAALFTSEGSFAELPLTSEPPLADAAPLTSEPPLADVLPLTSEPTANATAAGPESTGA
ncbi:MULTISPECIES: hypothetical protein [Streptomyces]|uniref:Secreted protein n=2 Tax=Streptomyces TaxID=1883 RepID=A0A0B5F5G1_STRA4|nr:MULTISPECIES: hypothetical protein [Streptomyces]AJE85602.1 hypothetical protein SLNWT_5226 [Streptomyces albus]AOU79904.1 hypothetical protein SLNHY_5213 [Streptomyces albus]AYN35621.1 hypothetical protein DUI70_5124 [Streptomyces albus]NKI42575.1 hypothetical protein [Streptomyces physcomitrii]